MKRTLKSTLIHLKSMQLLILPYVIYNQSTINFMKLMEVKEISIYDIKSTFTYGFSDHISFNSML